MAHAVGGFGTGAEGAPLTPEAREALASALDRLTPAAGVAGAVAGRALAGAACDGSVAAAQLATCVPSAGPAVEAGCTAARPFATTVAAAGGAAVATKALQAVTAGIRNGCLG